jgi:sortase (surface protein transpeptidase)
MPATLRLASGGVTMSPQIETRHTIVTSGKEYFDVPSHPSKVAWYDQFGTLGKAGSTTLMAAHINYMGYGAGPFAKLTSTKVGDTLTVTDAGGKVLSYSVQSVQVTKLSQLDMNLVVYPSLGAGKERLTLISCGGTFVPNPSGSGGQYDSRVIVVTERYVD